jgi:hypothetical protein
VAALRAPDVTLRLPSGRDAGASAAAATPVDISRTAAVTVAASLRVRTMPSFLDALCTLSERILRHLKGRPFLASRFPAASVAQGSAAKRLTRLGPHSSNAVVRRS